MRLVSVVGARPQFIKIAPFAAAVERHNDQAKEAIESLVVHTGQHYDAAMSDRFFSELDLPTPSHNLGVGSGRHGAQTARMLEEIERVLLEVRPDLVLTYGDTNSTLAAALCAAKLHIPTAHVESGLRSFNRRMPEEINRIVADHTSDVLFAPTPTAVENLRREGLEQRTMWVGDCMYDAVLHFRGLAASRSAILERLGLTPRRFLVATLHRAENTDDPRRLRQLMAALRALAERGETIVFPVHPRTKAALQRLLPDWAPHPRLQLIEPVGYLDMIRLVADARLVLTDSGGVQKEAFFLGCPCVTLRDETEWVETVAAGANVIAGVDTTSVVDAASELMSRCSDERSAYAAAVEASFGRGDSAARMLNALLSFHHERRLV